jgi:regulator of protease activity HflC (stomatin/prohibitin superfamily)
MLAVVSLILAVLAILLFPFAKLLHLSRGLLFILLLIALGVFASQSFVIIDAGEAGVQVFFGKVIAKPLYSGINFKLPLVEVVKYPTRLREYTMSADSGEGSRAKDDSISVRTFDGLEVFIDATVWWTINPVKIHDIYRSTAKNTAELEEKVVRPTFRTEIRNVVSTIRLNDLYSTERELLGNKIKERLERILDSKGLIIENILLRNIKLPEDVEGSIRNKMRIQQEAEAMEAKKMIAQKDAEIKQIEAEGLAKAQDIIRRTLSPQYLQHEAIQAYRELAKSPNTTFVIMPTTSDGTGLPLIVNTPPVSLPAPQKELP